MKIVFDSPFNLGIFNNGDWLFEKYKYRCEKYDWWWNYFLVKDGKLIPENFAKVSLPIANFYTKRRLKRIFKLKDIEETKWKAYNYTKEWWKLLKQDESDFGAKIVRCKRGKGGTGKTPVFGLCELS